MAYSGEGVGLAIGDGRLKPISTATLAKSFTHIGRSQAPTDFHLRVKSIVCLSPLMIAL